MNAPHGIKLIAENLAEEACALAPGGGWCRPIEIDAAGLRTWLDNFAALPALETEEANACLHLSVPGHRLVVRWIGGRLGTDVYGTFAAATIAEIEAQLLGAIPPSAGSPLAASAAPERTPPASARVRAQTCLLTGLLALFAVEGWWLAQPETIDGVEWITNANERQAVLDAAAGGHASDDEKLHLDAATARLTATNPEGEQTLSTMVRVGRQTGGTVLATESGVLLHVVGNGQLRVNATNYRRIIPGG